MADDFSSDSTRPGALAVGGQTAGKWEARDDGDWFRITLGASQWYTFELSGDAGFVPKESKLGVFNADGVELSYIIPTAAGSPVKLNFMAVGGGDYYVMARDLRAAGYSPIGYTLKAFSGLAGTGDSRATAEALTLGQATRGTIDSGSDVDYYKVALQEGKTYTLAPSWNPDGGSGLNGTMRVEDADGKAVTSVYGASGSFTATRTGDYYIAASNPYSSTQAYALTLGAAPDDHGASETGAGALTVGSRATGTLNVAQDKDWYGVALAAGTTYWFTLGTAPTTSSGAGYASSSAVLKVMDADGNTVATSSPGSVGSGAYVLLQYVPGKSGSYYVEVADQSGRTGNYAIAAALGDVDDHGDTTATATTLAVGATLTGRLAIGTDTDVFKFAVQAGSTYMIEMTARDAAGGATPSLATHTGNGYSGDGVVGYTKPGVTSYKLYTASHSGDYYLSVSNSAKRGDSGYTLKVSAPPADDYAAAKTTAGEVAIGGGATTGKIDYTGDVDWIKVTLQFGARYAFQLRGAGSGEGTLDGGSLAMASGAQAGSAYLTNERDGIYTFTSQTGGDYYLAVHGKASSTVGDGTGSYTLTAVALAGDTTAPRVMSHSPAEGAGMYDNIVVRFSEAIMRGDSAGYGVNYITLRDGLGAALESYSSTDSRIAIDGATLTINPGVKLKPGSKYLLDMGAGSVTDLAGNKYAGGELFAVNTTPTVTAGTAGDDYMIGLGSGIKLNGGAGLDTVIYGATRASYVLIHTPAETQVQGKGAVAGLSADVLTGVERLMFSDVGVALDTAGAGGQAYRLYRAAFDRAPDKAGVGYWIAQLDKGAALLDVARGFVDSAEFSALYGAAPANGAFVEKLYANVLHRAPDQGGVDYWTGTLNQGASRAEVLAAFSEGGENQAAALKVIGNGFDYTPYG
ncbi:DUF4214 domain-containing protein [Pseudoduganella namucuonensis]|uniref:DUF4214 domain-containing protein n=1 Tax=Pseudoduganella namucuonensis TaxID=1035707 RepID=A0A1I7KWT3_9BURK|nr:DUF4214 domain-containing protein [Pseudoduganella namucuonensis]SFV01828.1 protein of unknown function [Pseudoduganella namucuonensis]